MRYYGKPVVAKKTYNNVTIGYIVGWKALHWNFVRNIRENLIFDSATKARNFLRRMEKDRIEGCVTFEILDDKE